MSGLVFRRCRVLGFMGRTPLQFLDNFINPYNDSFRVIVHLLFDVFGAFRDNIPKP